MRILEIRFSNLNSLVGDWIIDLTDPAYEEDGLFAITGPTGAGKTTILDALCLALFGQTPRLGKITKTANDLMSRQEGECYAEVSFETQDGIYRCHFSQRRAYGKKNGELQHPKHEIVDARTNVVLENSLRGVAEKVTSLTGMDFTRFTRSMLLAQGGFAAFLHANPADRAPLLEDITGTGIYSDISIAVFERNKKEKEKLLLLEEENKGIALLREDEEATLKTTLNTLQEQEKSLQKGLAEKEDWARWLQNLTVLTAELEGLDKEQKALALEKEHFEEEKALLLCGERAERLRARHVELSTRRRDRKQDTSLLEQKGAYVPVLEKALSRAIEEAELKRKEALDSEREEREFALVLARVRDLDQALVRQKKDCTEKERRVRDLQKTVENLTATLTSLYSVKEQKSSELQALIEKNSQDDPHLGTLIPALEELIRARADEEKEYTEATRHLKEAQKKKTELSRLKEKAITDQGKRKRALQGLFQEEDRLTQALSTLLQGKSSREYRDKKEALLEEQSTLRQIASFEDERAKLLEGQPCPLCGSCDHPYIVQSVPHDDGIVLEIAQLTNVLRQAEHIEEEQKRLLAAREEKQHLLAESEKTLIEISSKSDLHDEYLLALENEYTKRQARLREVEERLKNALLPFGLRFEQGGEPPEKTLALLKKRVEEAESRHTALISLEKALRETEAAIEKNEALRTSERAHSERCSEEWRAAQEEYQRVDTLRKSLFGTKNPDSEEKRMHELLARAAEEERRAREKEAEAKETLVRVRGECQMLEKRLEESAQEFSKLEADFLLAVQGEGFVDENAFLQALLEPLRLRSLQEKNAALENKEVQLETKRQERTSRLEAAKALQKTDLPLETVERLIQESVALIDDNHAQSQLIQQRILQNDSAKERVATNRQRLEQQQAECARWGLLSSLIGSSDGKKYREFVQILTFERMVRFANQELKSMTDRYILIRDQEVPLALNVIDRYQADTIRTTKNLSGGESFLVSLALALGLARMASKTVRVDSLFLDEGFGTLDDDALDTALQSLAGLQKNGKLIGVISHLPQLQERIATRILVEPRSGGRSVLIGPGVRRREPAPLS